MVQRVADGLWGALSVARPSGGAGDRDPALQARPPAPLGSSRGHSPRGKEATCRQESVAPDVNLMPPGRTASQPMR